MSTTTPRQPGERIANGVRVHPNGQSIEVRVSPFPPRAGFALDNEDAAIAYAIKLRDRRDRGITTIDEHDDDERTLAHATRDHLRDLETIGGRHGTPYGEGGMTAARRDARPWLGETIPPPNAKGGVVIEAPKPNDTRTGTPFAHLPLDELALGPIDSYLKARFETTPRAAVGEKQMLQAVLGKELARGRKLNPALVAGLPRLKRRKTKRPPFGPAEYAFLLPQVVANQRRVFELGMTLGGRIMELLSAEDAWLDGDVLTVPAWACKERRDKRLPLLAEEVQIIREARLARSAATVRGPLGTRLIFPRKEGTAWDGNGNFTQQIVMPARRRAARAWREQHDLAADAPTPFEWIVRDRHGKVVLYADGTPKIAGFQPHDLRRSAATIMRSLGIPPELAAARLGHKDAGYLLLTVYADSREEELRSVLRKIDDAGGVTAALKKAAAG